MTKTEETLYLIRQPIGMEHALITEEDKFTREENRVVYAGYPGKTLAVIEGDVVTPVQGVIDDIGLLEEMEMLRVLSKYSGKNLLQCRKALRELVK